MSAESIHLSFKQGSADKVYNAAILAEGDGWLVNFSYGRRGKPLRTGTKTAKPLPYDQAKLAYDKLVQAKMSKGYTEDGSGTPFTGSQQGPERTGWLPQLLNPIEADDLADTFMRFRHVALQTKHDGERRAIIHKDGELYGSNRRGLKVDLHPTVQNAFQRLIAYFELSDFVLDAEDMGEYVVVFDVLTWEGEDATTEMFSIRALHLSTIKELCSESAMYDAIVVDEPYFARNIELVEDFVAIASNDGEEGVVLRDPTAPYTAGRPNSGGPCIKLKFYASATCMVQSIHPTKRSIGLELHDEQGMLDFVGNCTIPPNYDIPQVGDLVEIKYLYAYRNGSIYQPQYKGVRTDLDSNAAVTRQLKYKDEP